MYGSIPVETDVSNKQAAVSFYISHTDSKSTCQYEDLCSSLQFKIVYYIYSTLVISRM